MAEETKKSVSFDDVPDIHHISVDLSGEIQSGDEKMMQNEPEGAIPPDSNQWLKQAGQLFPAKATVATEWISNRRQGLKSWREFFQTNKFGLPKTPVVAGKRLTTNIDQFQSNYLCVFVILTIYCILTSPTLLFALLACLGLLYFIKVRAAAKSLAIGGKEISPAYQYIGVACLSFPLLWIAGAGTTIFWVIGASMVFIGIHAITYASEPVPGAEFLTMEEV